MKSKCANNPAKYWEKKLNFEINKEIQIYNYLCGNHTKKKIINGIPENRRFSRYADWRKYVINSIYELDKDTLNEFYHFIKYQKRTADDYSNSLFSLLIPIFVGVLVALIANIVTNEKMQQAFQTLFSVFNQINGNNQIALLYKITLYIFCIALIFIFYIITILVIIIPVSFLILIILKHINSSKSESAFWEDYLQIVKDVINER